MCGICAGYVLSCHPWLLTLSQGVLGHTPVQLAMHPACDRRVGQWRAHVAHAAPLLVISVG